MTEDRKGALADHERKGREYLPKLRQLPLTLTDNFRDEGPDFLWPSLLWVVGGDKLVLKLVEVQKVLADQLSGARPRFDGRLSTLESWTESERKELAPVLRAELERHDLLPVEIVAVFRMYSGIPGFWLISDLLEVQTQSVIPQSSLLLEARALAEWGRGGHLEALTKYLTFCWGVLTKSMTFGSELIEYMHDYPQVVGKLGAAESMIRAGYGAHRGTWTEYELGTQIIALAWARAFWSQNWTLTGCLPEFGEEALPDEAAGGGDAPAGQAEDTEDELVVQLATELGIIVDDFLEWFHSAPVLDLYDPLPSEVVSGLILRAISAVASVVRAPHQWSSQFGAGALRQMAETEILFGWFAAHPEDFEKYRDYGLGHEKLTWLHVEDLLDVLPTIPSSLEKVAVAVEKRRKEGPALDTTVVNVGPTFNGISLRSMAQEVGLADLYRSVFQASSAELHAEWEPVRRENLMRCLNPLHRFHLIPSTEPPWIHDPTFPKMLVGMLTRLVGIGKDKLGGP
jgi:hypothetical protein